MSSEEETLYKYTVPIEEIDGTEQPAYDTISMQDALDVIYTADSVVYVVPESTPHFHKDSVNVKVEEVEASEYGYEPESEEGE